MKPVGYVLRIEGSPFWHARFIDASGRHVQRSTKATDKHEAEIICAEWALAAYAARKKPMLKTKVLKVFHQVAEIIHGEAKPLLTVKEYICKYLKSRKGC